MILGKIYAIYSKESVADIIMDSRIREYDQQMAVQLLEGFRKQKLVDQGIFVFCFFFFFFFQFSIYLFIFSFSFLSWKYDKI